MKKQLEDLFIIQSGGTPSRSEPSYWQNGNIPWVKIGDIEKGSVLNTTEEYITEEGLKSIGGRLFEKGTVLFAMYGATIGKTAIAWSDVSCNQAVLTFNSKNPKVISNYFIQYWLIHKQKELLFKSRGGAQTNLSAEIIKKLEINVPDLEIQNRIVATLDKIQSLVDKRKKTIALLDELAKAAFLEMFGDPFLNEKNFSISKLHDLGEWKSGGTPTRSNAEFFLGSIPWITSGELNNIYISDSKEKITEDAINKSSTKIIEEGSLLLGMYDTAALKSSITTVIATCNQAIAFSKLDEKLCSTIFVFYAVQILKEKYLSQRLGARQQNLNLKVIKNIEIPLPNFEDQKKFEMIVISILNKRSKVVKSFNLLEFLLQSISQDVFNEKELISEEDLFEDLVKTFKEEDYLKDSKRLRYLINALKQHKFKNYEAYDAAQKMVFVLLENQMLRQSYNDGDQKIELLAPQEK